MKQIINKIKIIAIFFIAIAFQGCVEDQVEFPKAFAEFTYSVNQETGVVKFINTSRNASIFSWTFGDGQSSTEINPSHIYQPGTYTVSLVSKNVAGSFRTYQDVIIIGDPNDNTGGGGSDCTAEAAENINPANGDINWTFKTNDTAHTFAAFGNTSGSIVANPVPDAVNSSCNVEEFVKTNGCETWSGLGTELTTALNFASATNKVFKMKVLAQNQVANVTLRLERLPFPDTDPAVEKVASITKVGEWEELTFDFSDVTTGTYKSMIIYFERNATCDGDTYYFDDIMQVAGGAGGGTGGGACTAEAVESLVAADFNLTFKTNDVVVIEDGTAYTRVANPKEDAVNSSCFAGKVVNSSTNPWDNVQINVATKLDFDANAGFKMKVYSPKAGTKVTMKLEEIGAAGNNTGDVAAVRTKTGEWEELTFPFPATASGKFNKIVIFFDLESKNSDTYHFDDLKLYARTTSGGGGTCPEAPTGELLSNGNFEAGAVCWQFFPGTSVSTTVNNGGSNSAEIQGSTGVAVGLKMERFGVGAVLPNTSYTVSFDIIASGAFGDGGVFKSFTFSEGADGGTVAATQHILTDGTTSLSTTWEKKTYTFTTAANANQVAGGLSFLIEIVNSAVKLHVDNVVIKRTP